MQKETRRQGFTLIELSIVLVIISIVTGMAVTSGISLVSTVRFTATQKKMRAIDDALMAYRATNDRLPCPGDLTLASGSADYGLEAGADAGSSITTATGVCTGSGMLPQANFTALGAAEGALPALSLGLPADFMVDGWGNKFRYAVDISMTKGGIFSTTSAGANCGPIVVNDANGNNRTAQATYAVISHGANGHGAYTKSGVVVNAGSTSVDELTNCHCTSTGASGTYAPTYVQKAPQFDAGQVGNATYYFDDMVNYKERWQLQTAWDSNTSSVCPQMMVGVAWNSDTQTFNPKSFVSYGLINNGFTPTEISFSSGNQYMLAAGGWNCAVYQSTSSKGWTYLPNAIVNTIPGKIDNCNVAGAAGAISPDGKYIVLAGGIYSSSVPLQFYQQTSTGVWTLIGGPSNPPTQPNIQPGSYGGAQWVQWSPDGKYIYIYYNINTVFLYKNAGGIFTQMTFPAFPATATSGASVLSAAFSPDGKAFMIASNENFPCKIYAYTVNETNDNFTFNNGIAQSDNNCSNASFIAYSPNGQYLAQGSYYGTNIYVYKIGMGPTFTLLPNPASWTGAWYNYGEILAWSADSTTIAVGHPNYGSNVDVFTVSGTTLSYKQSITLPGNYANSIQFTH